MVVFHSTSNRADSVLLAHPLSGHTPLSKSNADLLYTTAGSTCPLCIEEPKTVNHWPKPTWQRTFDSPAPPLGVLTTDQLLGGADAHWGHLLASKITTKSYTRRAARGPAYVVIFRQNFWPILII